MKLPRPALALAVLSTLIVSAGITPIQWAAAAQPAQALTGSLAAAAAAPALAVDQQVATHQSAASTTISSPPLTTAQSGELILAFVMSDGSATTRQTVASVSGGGLTWRLRQRSNVQAGTSEIWQAAAPSQVSKMVVTATRGNGSAVGSLVVTSFIGASTSVNGATAAAAGQTGAPTATLTPTTPGSWVWAAGNDWDRAATRSVGPNQTMVDQYLASVGDTFWVQRRTTPATGTSLTPITINDTAPTNDRWNLALIEIPPAAVVTPPADTTAPVISSVAASSIGQTQATIGWTTNEAATTRVSYGTTTAYGTDTATTTALTTAHSQVLTGLIANTTYHFRVRSADAAGNVANSVDATFTAAAAPPADATAPTASLTAPANGATVSGTIAVSASAADNVGVASVQFKVDGTNVGAADTSAPYSTQWDTTTASNSGHVLVAVARDAAGNTVTSAPVTVTVNNSAGNVTFNPGNLTGTVAVPTGMGLENVSQPDRVIGDGTAAGCTSAAVLAAVTAGGVITFNCGPDPITITLTQTAKVRNSTKKLVIDGGGKVTLSGGNANRILYVDTCDTSLGTVSGNCLYAPEWPQVTVQNITFANGNATNSTYVSPGDTDQGSNGGGAIFQLGGRLKVVRSAFVRNTCAANGPDLGGAAIRVLAQHSATPNDLDNSQAARNQDPVSIVQSTFGGASGQGNNCSNGAAISGLRTPITVLNSLITYNNAIGCCANPPNAGTPGGGSGGAIYTDGTSYDLRIAGTDIENNSAKAGGSAIFFVSNDRTGHLIIDSSTIKNNTYAPSGQPSDPHFQNYPGIFYIGSGNPTFTNSTIQ